jgi:hypothetical protein
MAILPAIRRLRRFGVLALLAFWSVSPTAGLVRELAEALHHHAEDHDHAEIEAPGHEPLICEHHPQGCPKHCVCPKITRLAEGNPADVLLPDDGPVIARCAEKDPRQAPPVLSLLLAEPVWRMAGPPESSSVFARGEPRLPADPFRDPPHKVPRS